MNKPFRKRTLATCVALLLAAAGSAVAADAPSQDLLDARQETQIWTTFALHPYLRANDLKVSVQDGKATLTGKVEEGVNKELATQIALGVAGIRDVDNQIVVQSNDAPPGLSATRSYGELIDDATITTVVKQKLIWSKYTNGLSTEVDTQRGRVTLRGTVDNAASKELAGRLAGNTRGVVSVDNRLAVNGSRPTLTASARESADQAAREITDAWITTKVKSTFLYSRNVPGSEIAVSTHNRVVTLRGKVHNGAEHALAVELARNVRGVASVRASNLTF